MLFAVGLPDLESVAAVCAAVQKPINVLMSYHSPPLPVIELERAGVRRSSVGSGLTRAAEAAALGAATRIVDRGRFNYCEAIEAAFADYAHWIPLPPRYSAWGHRWGASPEAIVFINPTTGVLAEYYHHYARLLARHDFEVIMMTKTSAHLARNSCVAAAIALETGVNTIFPR